MIELAARLSTIIPTFKTIKKFHKPLPEVWSPFGPLVVGELPIPDILSHMYKPELSSCQLQVPASKSHAPQSTSSAPFTQSWNPEEKK